MTELGGIEVVTSPYVPPGTFVVVGDVATHGALDAPLDFRPDPWWRPPPPGLGDVALRERRRALDWLADRLDDLCHDFGIDPDVWRGPRAEALRATHERAIQAELRYSLSIRRSADFVRVTNV